MTMICLTWTVAGIPWTLADLGNEESKAYESINRTLAGYPNREFKYLL
jgi:hypothetical protein